MRVETTTTTERGNMNLNPSIMNLNKLKESVERQKELEEKRKEERREKLRLDKEKKRLEREATYRKRKELRELKRKVDVELNAKARLVKEEEPEEETYLPIKKEIRFIVNSTPIDEERTSVTVWDKWSMRAVFTSVTKHPDKIIDRALKCYGKAETMVK